MKYSLLILMLAFSVACGKKSSGGSKKINQIFVKGDPLTMIEGTNQNTNSFITNENLSSLSGFALSNIFIFSEKELISTEETEDIEAGQEATEQDETKKTPPLFSMQLQGSTARYVDSKNELGVEFRYNFTTQSYGISGLIIKSNVFPVSSVQHYSISPDKSKMSFLFNVEDEAGRNLVSITFYKYNTIKATIPKVSSSYKYIYGPGVVVPWKLDATRQIKINVCPSNSSYVTTSEVRRAFEKWERAFDYKAKKLDIVVNQVASCKPFSDVNEQALHYVGDYLTMPDKDAYNPGFAMIHGDMSAGNIFDADIVLLGAETRKDPGYTSSMLARTLTHEFGHFLGLDHMFEGQSSIMSYRRVTELTWYDQMAITELYKE